MKSETKLRTHYSTEVPREEGAEVKLAGFVEHIRVIGKLKFLVLRDKKGKIQITTRDEKLGKIIESLTKESFICVKGKVRLNPEIFILEGKIVEYLEDFCRENDFTRIFTSRITSAATEGGADYFKVRYFDRDAYLAQSPQLYKESILASGIDKVYEVGFVYRAEPHHTTRHLCEYVSFDIEMVCRSLEELLELETNMLRFLFEKLKSDEEARQILAMYNQTLNFPSRIPRFTFEEANKILTKLGIETSDEDISPAGEKALCDYVKREFNSEFVFITHYPFKAKPFYIMRCETNSELCLAFDLLFRGLEITSGGIREHRYEKRVENILAKGLDPKQYDHLRFFKYGMPPHGGFAIGIERLTMLILGLKNIRETSLLPRDPKRLTP